MGAISILCALSWLNLSTIITCCSAMDVYIRTSGNVTCHSWPCLTLDEFARYPKLYISPWENTFILFSPGIHQLHHSLYIDEVSNVTFFSFNNTAYHVLISDPSAYILVVDSKNITITGMVIKTGNGDSKYYSTLLSFLNTNNISLAKFSVVGYATMQQASVVYILSSYIKISDVTISNITTYDRGSVLTAFKSTLIFCGENIFMNNTVTNGRGGALEVRNCTVSFYGKVLFANNTSVSSITVSDDVTFFYHNGGGAIYCDCSAITFTGLALFIHNQAIDTSSTDGEYTIAAAGGAIIILWDSMIIFQATSSTLFSENTADFNGGAIAIFEAQLTMRGQTFFRNNAACKGGGAVSISKFKLEVAGAIFEMNSAGCAGSKKGYGGAIEAYEANVTLSGHNIFFHNRANLGGASYYSHSIVDLEDWQEFESNSAQQGGALTFSDNARLMINEFLHANFTNNSAKNYGGVIFWVDTTSMSECIGSRRESNLNSNDREICYIDFDFICTKMSVSLVQFRFIHNTAGVAGTVLYGGNLDSCRVNLRTHRYDCPVKQNFNAIQVFQEFSYTMNIDSTTSNISSDPLQICICENDEANATVIDCDPPSESIKTVRGKEFTLLVVTVGQNKGINPSFVRTSLDNEVQISAKQRVQRTGKKCTQITYRLHSANNFTALVLFPDGPCRDIGISRREFSIEFLPCPDGFSLSGSECICDENLKKYTTKCSVNDNSIERLSNTFWVRALYDNGSYEGLILHSSCPLDYCMDTPVYIKLDNIDIQCDHNHSGTLCGSCNINYSIAFGTLHCLPCSNDYLALLIPFALAGIALVIILLLLQLTVASGTMNGLIFYANVIQASRAIFFMPGDANILTIFIAWMNLDLGIEMCFYNGMSVYVFTWLQFLFPFHVWFLIFLIIKLSRHSRRIARMFGTNPVSVLATLFLLSYSKILRAIILALSTTSLEYPDGTLKRVWLYDGSIPYFQRFDHIALGAFAIMILFFLFLPYTLLLLFGHFLQAYSHWCILSWLNKIKPFMDAYHAPYRKETRYWTGLILLLRCALFLTFALTSQSNLKLDLVIITSISAGLATLAWMHRGIYERISLDILESSFTLNLCVFAVATYHVNKSMQRQISHAFVGISFATFICIILYHIYLSLSKTSLWKKLLNTTRSRVSEKVIKMCKLGQERNRQLDEQPQDLSGKLNAPTTSTVELCEPLLLDTDTHSYQ